MLLPRTNSLQRVMCSLLLYRLVLQGNLHVQFTHDNMDYKNSLINATHIVSHLTFGDQLPVSVASLLDKIDADGPGFNTLGDHEFVSAHADRTYEHFIQVSC